VKKPWIAPIVGKTKLVRFTQNTKAAQIVLTPGGLRERETSAANITVRGDCNTENLQKRFDRQSLHRSDSHGDF